MLESTIDVVIESESVVEQVDADASLVEETVSIFIEEAEEHLQTIDQFLQSDDSKSQDYNGLIRALHTLRGSSSMAQIEEILQTGAQKARKQARVLLDSVRDAVGIRALK